MKILEKFKEHVVIPKIHRKLDELQPVPIVPYPPLLWMFRMT